MSITETRLIVDADACPKTVKNIVAELAHQYGAEVILLASFNHHLETAHLPGRVQTVTVSAEPQAVDLKMINLTHKRDIAVTQDWGLAAVLLGKGACVIAPNGRIYQNDKIEFLLEQRHLQAKIRRSGGRTKGPSARTTEDDERFYRTLEQILKKEGHS
ncbi:MAG: YaiI/YqxD family protein [Clostridia bacterium]|jgi:uncharacterized protein YaiI (UPF0178 family)|nr:YaiI/YqxD family protein [Clostridia bacterium]